MREMLNHTLTIFPTVAYGVYLGPSPRQVQAHYSPERRASYSGQVTELVFL